MTDPLDSVDAFSDGKPPARPRTKATRTPLHLRRARRRRRDKAAKTARRQNR